MHHDWFVMTIEDPSDNPELTPFPSPPSEHIDFVRQSPPSEGRFDRFFQRINQFFTNEPPNNTLLQGRIQELQSNADKVLAQLVDAKEALEQRSVDPFFILLVNSVFDPFIKELGRIQRAMNQDFTSPRQVKITNRYAEWVDKAKWWVDTCSRLETAEAACPLLLEHAVREFHFCIDRDIKLIQDYINQGIQSLELSESAHSELEERLSKELGIHLTTLHQLKMFPSEDSIEAFHVWRAQADSMRARCFSDALHIIDTITDDVLPLGNNGDEKESHPEQLSTIVALEARLTQLAIELEFIDGMDNAFKRKCAAQLSVLEEEAHRLNGDLRLKPEHSDRVQSALELLESFRLRLEL